MLNLKRNYFILEIWSFSLFFARIDNSTDTKTKVTIFRHIQGGLMGLMGLNPRPYWKGKKLSPPDKYLNMPLAVIKLY